MIRLLAFALNAHERLEFGKGVSDHDEPDLWQKDLTGEIDLWIELGHPDEKLLAKAVGRSSRVIVYTYSPNPGLWWDPIKHRFEEEALCLQRQLKVSQGSGGHGRADHEPVVRSPGRRGLVQG
jgi:uncharacterized protein YaeQ